MSSVADKKPIICIVGTRPECIKMAPVIRALEDAPWARPIVVSTGQHRELVHQILGMFKIKIDHDLDVMQPNQTLAGLSSRIFAKIDPLIEYTAPHMMIVQGDTTSVMTAALAAFYRKLPIGHVEAGLRTQDLKRPFPEELNRRITGVVADLHFAPTERARDNLLREHHAPDSIHVTGNTVIDALLDVASRDIPCDYPKGSDRKLVLVTAHRRENFGEPFAAICQGLADIHDRYSELEFVYPVHPNPNVYGPAHSALGTLERMHLIPPADYQTLVGLMRQSHFVLTDSGGIQEEAPALGKPVLVLRDETERPEAVEAGVAMLVGPHRCRIVQTVDRLMTEPAFFEGMADAGSPYGDGHAAARIVEHCARFVEGKS